MLSECFLYGNSHSELVQTKQMFNNTVRGILNLTKELHQLTFQFERAASGDLKLVLIMHLFSHRPCNVYR